MNQQETKILLKDAYKTIKQLISDEKWLEAHRACLEILRFDPDNIKIIRYKNIVEKNVKKINIKAIKEDLQKLKPLWDEKKYEELLSNLKELEPYISDYPPLKKIILKAENEYRKGIRAEQSQYFENELAGIRKLLEKKNFQEALRNAEKLRIIKLNETEVRDWIRKIRTMWVENELVLHETLLKSDKYEDILLFLQKMKKVFPDYEKLDHLIDTAKKKAKSHQLDEKRDFIFVGLEKTRTLIQLKKFAKAVEAAKEILAVDPVNTTAKAYLKTALRKEKRLITKELIKQIKSTTKEMKKQYKENKKDFIRI